MKKIFMLGSMILVGASNATNHEKLILVARIEHHVQSIQDIARKHQGFKQEPLRMSPEALYQTLDGLVSYKHEVVKACIAQIRKEKSLAPFFAMWNSFKNSYQKDAYATISQDFLKECSDLIFMFYSNMMNQLIDDHAVDAITVHRVTAAEIIQIYLTISELPINEFLDLLDKVLEKIMTILEDYHPEEGQSLFSWLQKNWWIPPVIIGGLLGSVYGF